MSSVKSLNTYPSENQNKTLSSDGASGEEWGDIYEEYGYEGYEDYSSDSFGSEESWGLESEGLEDGAPLTILDLREELRQFEAELKSNPDISKESREKIVAELRARINKAAFMAETQQAPELADILLEMDSTREAIPQTTEMAAAIDALLSEIEGQELPATFDSKKSEWIEALEKAKPKIDLNLEDSSSTQELIDTIRDEFEVAKGEAEEQTAALNAPIDNLLAYLQSKGDATTTADSLKQALSDAGLTLQDLQNVTLPTNAATHEKIYRFIEKVDSRFAQLLKDNGDPFSEEVTNRFIEVLSQVLPNSQSLTPANTQKIFQDSGHFFYPEENAVAANIIDSNHGHEAKGFAHAVDQAIKTGDWEPVRSRFIGMSGEMGNDIMRKFITGLYLAVGEDEAAFQQALDRIPADIRESMARIAYATWAERSEKYVEDKWNSHETQSILYNSVYSG